MERTTALFHERDRVEIAVRELTEHGVDEGHIFIEHAPIAAVGEDRAPRGIGGLPHRVEFAGIGGALGMLTGLAVSGSPTSDTMGTLWLVIVGGLAGLLLGGLVGLAVGGFRRATWMRRVADRDWLVRVDTDDHGATTTARQVLRETGGELTYAA